MGKRKITKIIGMILFLLVFSLPIQALTTTEVRENTIRINALELKEVDITSSEAPKNLTIVLDERALHFDFNKSDVKEDFFELLKNLKEFVEENNYEVTIVGHTDAKGTNEYNMKLGMRRAESVKAKLLEFGVPADRIVGVESRGEEEPVATNSTDEGRALNRRIEFKLIRKN